MAGGLPSCFPGTCFIGSGESVVFRTRGLKQAAPGRDQGAPSQESPPFTFGHAAPDSVLDPVIEGIGQALGTHRAAGTQGFGPVLGRALDEKLVRISGSADRSITPGLLVFPVHPDAALSPVRPAALPWAGAVRERYGKRPRHGTSSYRGNPIG